MWTTNPEWRQRGFSVPAAIFIMVILAALGAFLVTIGSNQQLGHAQDVQGSRVVLAAKVGIEWAVFQVVNTNGAYRTACDSGSTSATLSNLTNMDGIVVVAACASTAYTEGATAFHAYQITATACSTTTCPNISANLPNLYVERRLVTLVTN